MGNDTELEREACEGVFFPAIDLDKLVFDAWRLLTDVLRRMLLARSGERSGSRLALNAFRSNCPEPSACRLGCRDGDRSRRGEVDCRVLKITTVSSIAVIGIPDDGNLSMDRSNS